MRRGVIKRCISIVLTILGSGGVLLYLELARNAFFHKGPETKEAWLLFVLYGHILLAISLFVYLIPGILLIKKKIKSSSLALYFLIVGILSLGVGHYFFPPISLILGIINLIFAILLVTVARQEKRFNVSNTQNKRV